MTSAAPLVTPGAFLTLHYRLAGPDGGDVINTFNEKPATLSLGSGELAPALEARLIGLAEGTRTVIELAPGEAFGQRNPEMIQRVALSLLRQLGDLDETWAVGDVVQFPTPMARGLLPGSCASWIRPGSGPCLTSTTPWRASPAPSKCN